MSKNKLAVLSLNVPINLADGGFARVQLLPDGNFVGMDGRPGTMKGVKAKAWLVDDAVGAALIAQANARSNAYVIDYEHQTLLSEANGMPAPAAGWFKTLEYIPSRDVIEDDVIAGGFEADDLGEANDIDDAGIFAIDVQWTPKAQAHISANEYKYISPVFLFEPETGRITQLLNAALTNNPNLDGMDAVRLALNKLNAHGVHSLASLTQDFNKDLPQETPQMKQLMAALKINQEATEADALAALTSLQTKLTTQDTELVALRANQFDPAKHIPMEEHSKVSAELVALKAEADKTEHANLMVAALSDGRILPPNEAYWKTQPLAVLTAFLAEAKPLLAALKGMQTGGKAPVAEGAAVDLTDEELAVCKALGQTHAEFLKSKASA